MYPPQVSLLFPIELLTFLKFITDQNPYKIKPKLDFPLKALLHMTFENISKNKDKPISWLKYNFLSRCQ